MSLFNGSSNNAILNHHICKDTWMKKKVTVIIPNAYQPL